MREIVKTLKHKTMSKKIKFQYIGQTFELPAESIKYDRYNNNTPYIYMSAKNTASVIKQYVKNNFPFVKVWATSDTYSGGSSVRINISNADGSPVTSLIDREINQFANSFKGGSFNGMIDMYEDREDEVVTDNGTKMDYFPSYIFVENRASWGTFEYWLNQYNTFDASNYSKPMVGETKWEQFWNFNKGYMKDSAKMLKTFTEYYTKLNIA